MNGRFTHGGDLRRIAAEAGLDEDAILDYSANLNPAGFPDWLRQTVSAEISRLARYPDPGAEKFVAAAARRFGVDESRIVAGNGATELLFTIPRTRPFRRAVIAEPAYVDYRNAARMAELEVTTVSLAEARAFQLDFTELEAALDGPCLAVLGDPNNPTGAELDAAALEAVAAKKPEALFVADESFAFFADRGAPRHWRAPNIVSVFSLTKAYAIPGLRLGVAVADERVAARLRALLPPWTVNALAAAVGLRAMEDAEYLERSRVLARQWRVELRARLLEIDGLTVFDSHANFLLLKLGPRMGMAKDLAARLLREGIAIRTCGDFIGLDDRFIRLAVRTPEENERLVDSLEAALAKRAAAPRRKRTPAIMFQGVSSSAGKSLLTAAMLRILHQDGLRVAPFKAQNMALNSYVTLDGHEIGRAQATQALAAGREPDTRMNPVLLKPNSDTGAQVVVMGKPEGSMDAAKYFSYKERLFPIVTAAYDSLAAENDVMVLEGAGSPAEVNLKARDIVNMAMARHARSPVLIVGDIDRGGVFGSLVGCMETMAEWERRLVAGFVINKFRGDESLLGDATGYLLRSTGKPTYGVIPYLTGLDVPEEDQVALRGAGAAGNGHLRIAVARLAHVSNFTDFDALMGEPDVTLVAAKEPADLDGADVVILPGSKNVIDDLARLKNNGMAERIRRMAETREAEVVGVCGGFQMAGRSVDDPHGIESSTRRIEGLGLLPVETTLMKEKTLARARATHAPSGLAVSGYEIHHGVTVNRGGAVAMARDDGEVIGVASADGMVWGTYLHGLFDDDAFRWWFLDRLRARKGLAPLNQARRRYNVNESLDRLAEVVRARMDIGALYRLMGLR